MREISEDNKTGQLNSTKQRRWKIARDNLGHQVELTADYGGEDIPCMGHERERERERERGGGGHGVREREGEGGREGGRERKRERERQRERDTHTHTQRQKTQNRYVSSLSDPSSPEAVQCIHRLFLSILQHPKTPNRIKTDRGDRPTNTYQPWDFKGTLKQYNRKTMKRHTRDSECQTLGQALNHKDREITVGQNTQRRHKGVNSGSSHELNR